VMGGDANAVQIVTAAGIDSWPVMPKAQVADKLIEKVAHALTSRPD